jgi:hypothetical protein
VETPDALDLSPDEVAALAEVAELPMDSRVLHKHSYGTYDGTGFDNLDPSAMFDCIFVCPESFDVVTHWLDARLKGLGWPGWVRVEAATTGGIRPQWLKWTRGKEEIDLLDATISHWSGFDAPEGWSMLRLIYARKPARDFPSDDEYQVWFKDDRRDKGARWRNRLQ